MQLSEEDLLLKKTVEIFAAEVVGPIAEEMDRKDEWPAETWKKMTELGILGITVPEEYGGGGCNILQQVLVTQALANYSAGLTVSYVAHSNLCCHNLYHNGTEAQRQKYLPSLCSGEKLGALALTEPGAGSDATGIQTSAKRQGDHYVLNGSKMFITNGPIADVIIVYAKTDKTKGAHGVTAFIVEKGFPGFSASKPIEKMGNRGSMTGELVFEDCLVPVENVLGEENKGVKVMMSGLDSERIVVAALSLGIAEASFREAVKYAKERKQFGKEICTFQLIQAKIADMYTSIEASRLLIYDTAVNAANGQKVRKEAAAAILFTAEAATKIALDAVQIHGGYGYTLEYPVNRYLRDAKLYEIGAGTSEIRRLMIAREILGIETF